MSFGLFKTLILINLNIILDYIWLKGLIELVKNEKIEKESES